MLQEGVFNAENLYEEFFLSEQQKAEKMPRPLATIFLQHGSRRTYDKKSTVFRVNETAREAFFVEKGSVRTYQMTPDGKEVTFNFLYPGLSFGFTEVLLNIPRIRYTETISKNTTLLVMDKEQLFNSVFSNPEFCFEITRVLGIHLVKCQRVVEDLAILPVQGRVVQLLLRLAEERGLKAEDSTIIDLTITHDEIAKMVGGSRQKITVILNNLRQQRIISWEKKRIKILSRKNLIDKIR